MKDMEISIVDYKKRAKELESRMKTMKLTLDYLRGNNNVINKNLLIANVIHATFLSTIWCYCILPKLPVKTPL